MKKRILGIMLCLVMALSLLPSMAFAAGYKAGDIAGTTGAGTQSDPVICDNFAEFKAALEYAGDLYIQVDSFTNTTGLDYYALQPGSDYADQNTPAISVPAGYTKDLIINTDINLRAAATPVLPTLIKVSGNLIVSGNGSISCSFGGFSTPNAVIYIFYPGNVTVNGNVRIAGVLGNRVAHACAIDNYSGYLTINGGTFSGYSPDEVAESGENSWAVKVWDGSFSTIINGGTFSSTASDNNGEAYGLYCYTNKITISGGIFHGINAQHSEHNISDFLKDGYEYYKTSDNTLFDASAVKSTTEALKVVKQTPITSVEVTPNTVTIPRNSQQQFKATVSGTGFFSNEVTWSITGGDFGTNISSDGLLSVARANTENTIIVKATSVADPTKYGTATVTLTSATPETPETPGITSVEVTPNAITIPMDSQKQFTATVIGIGSFSDEVTWSIEGGDYGTNISSDGLLSVARYNTANTITVKATSVDDPTKYGTATVTLTSVNTYTVSFNMNGHGTQVADQTVEDGRKATKPADPTAEGWTFGGWYKDSACTETQKYDFDTPITADLDLYAKWTQNSVTLLGDVNGDGEVTDADAVYLLYYTFFGDAGYPVNQPCDFNGDGAVTDADAVYLLYYTFFGEESYPLH